MQVYRGMDVGTAKPSVIERRGITHHLIDVADPEEEFTVAEFRRLGRRVIEEADSPVVIAGGSGLHFRALVDPMSFAPTEPGLREQLEETELGELVAALTTFDDEASHHVDLRNKRRVVRALEVHALTGETPTQRASSAEARHLRDYVPEIEFTAVGVDPGSALDERIDRRLAGMRAGGLVEEVGGLRDRLGRTASLAVGYAEILTHLEGEATLDEAFDEIARNTRRLAKKQRTWFQRDPRIRWLPWTEDQGETLRRALEAIEP